MPLTERFSELLNEQREANAKLERVKEKADDLLLEAITHFDAYVEQVINPKLPEGYRLLAAKSVEYHVSGHYEIITGVYRTPKGISEESNKTLEDIILPLLDEYKRKHCWIGKIIPGFSLKE